MKMKKTVSAMIFSSMFIGAWYVQEQEHEEKRNQWANKNLLQPAGMNGEVVDAEAAIEIEPVADLQKEVTREPFKPREYIRLAK
ncbi:hypothetical protein FZC79_17045 [Rossellomorea vietnamensis]|uniref:Uncharacterized protein n=2 Tax=Rossellomorea TaxID=2837508 RepID=A0A5D4KAC0_9BACI|nr:MULTISPECIES: hypothetical protein [Rossellomorea]TYR73829.1 hypothetical protein FZC79_17045 [Rossellomorea vietnamensis]TYS76040.1 hypothetical protein FZC80_15885 [Rossellomorea aquimaris]